MRQISIKGRLGTVVLMKDLVFTITPKLIGSTQTMASGRVVMDIVGVQNTLKTPTGWLSVDDLALLKRMILEERILKVTYPDVGGTKTADFFFSPPVFKALIYDNDGVRQWMGVTLTATQQGVDEA